MTPPLIGLRFYDHSMDNAQNLERITCDVVGWLYAEDDLSYFIATWICDSRVKDHNTEAFQILKSTVIEKYVLVPQSVKQFKFGGRRAKKA